MPDQAHANAWAHRHTLGMIPTFPAPVGPDVAILLASALAAEVSWIHPVLRDGRRRTSGGTFGPSITLAACGPPQATPSCWPTPTPRGIVAVDVADAVDRRLRVISVIGPPDATPGAGAPRRPPGGSPADR